jgi:REP element-mobilizing transposase RayT
MTDPIRRCGPDLTYHVFSRCIDKSNLMKPDKMKDLMIKVMNMALEKYKFEFLSYVIMHNHFHFFIRTVEDGATISRIMQFIKAQYARRYNKLMGRSGPFWNERFGDAIIEESKDPQTVFNYMNCYIINNPVRAAYVADARSYKYGCANFYLDENYKPPVKLTFNKYFLNLGLTFKERVRKFLDIEEQFRKRIIPESVFV